MYQVKSCIESCLIATSISSGASVLSSGMLTDLTALVKRGVAAATAYSAALSSAGTSPQAPPTITVKAAEGILYLSHSLTFLRVELFYVNLYLVEEDSSPMFATVPELLQSLSCNRMPSNLTRKMLVNEIVQTTVKINILLWTIASLPI